MTCRTLTSHPRRGTAAQPVQPGLQQQAHGRVPLTHVHAGQRVRAVSGPGSMAQAYAYPAARTASAARASTVP